MTTKQKRKGRGKADKTLQLIQAAIRIAREIQPCSVRAICYRLFTEKLIRDMYKKSTSAETSAVNYGSLSGSATIIRLAIDDRDTGQDSKLPWFPASDKTGDTRHDWFTQHHGQRCWEVDALPPPELRERLDSAIESTLDIDAWNHAVGIESAEIESMRNIMGYFKQSISRLDQKYSDGSAT